MLFRAIPARSSASQCHQKPNGNTKNAINAYAIKPKHSKPKPIEHASVGRSTFAPSLIISFRGINMTQTQVGFTEQHLAQWVIYAVLVAPVIAILSRDLGFGPVASWVSHAIIAAPMIAMLSHREINVDPLLRWILYVIIALTVILPSRF